MPNTSPDNSWMKQPISKRELLAYREDLKSSIFRQIRQRFLLLANEHEFSQSWLAKRLDVDKGVMSRRLRAENDMRVETLCDLARGLECRIDVRLTPLSQIVSMGDLCAPLQKTPTNLMLHIDHTAERGAPLLVTTPDKQMAIAD